MSKQKRPTGLEPQCVALLICDLVYVDPFSGRHTLLGVFDELDAVVFPMTYSRFSVFAAVSDGRGKTPIILRMTDIDESADPIWSYETEVDFSDPHIVQEVSIEIRDAVFPLPGTYRVQLLASGATIMDRRFQVHDVDSIED